MKKLIDVCVIIFPDGTNHFFRAKPVLINMPNANEEYMKKCLHLWIEKNHQRYDNINLLFPIIGSMKMLKTDFRKLPATADFLETEKN